MTVEEVLWMAYDAPVNEDEFVRLRVVEQVYRLLDSPANKTKWASPYTTDPLLAVSSLTLQTTRAEVPSEQDAGDGVS